MNSFRFFLLSVAWVCRAASDSYFAPDHRVSGVGAGRPDISEDLLAVRTDLMVKSQTFAIMRDPLAVPGAARITGARLQPIFKSAARASGFPQSTLEAVTYLESWGDPAAESYSGPKGIMQISEATARRMGLKIIRATRYRITAQKVPVRRKGKTVLRTVQKKTPYTVTVRDERLMPDKAIPAAARYLQGLEQRYGSRDWAVFAYHCGEGCVAEMMELTRQARGVKRDEVTVARMFFAGSPAWNRDLYQAIQRNMDRDYSPTYWFRIRRAEELLALYRRAPDAFRALADEYRSQFYENTRAPHRLSVWLKKEDFVFQSCEDMRADSGRRLAKALQNPEYFGYRLAAGIGADDPGNQRYYLQASPAALGTLAYIAYEARRLHEAMKPRGERWEPLEVTALVQPADRAPRPAKDNGRARSEALSHCSGQVFDIAHAKLPPGQRECLRFVLNDLGWEGYLGFVEEGPDTLHIGCSPSSREFFTTVFQEALRAADHVASDN
jgi:hypothetical protein